MEYSLRSARLLVRSRDEGIYHRFSTQSEMLREKAALSAVMAADVRGGAERRGDKRGLAHP